MLQLIISCFLLFATGSNVEWLTPTEHDFGDIKQGVPVTVEFRFKNIGAQPLTIDNVRATCGCTSPNWEATVIEPGKEGSLKIEYDAFKPGYFRKKITIFFSGQRQAEKLYVEGYVE